MHESPHRSSLTSSSDSLATRFSPATTTTPSKTATTVPTTILSGKSPHRDRSALHKHVSFEPEPEPNDDESHINVAIPMPSPMTYYKQRLQSQPNSHPESSTASSIASQGAQSLPQHPDSGQHRSVFSFGHPDQLPTTTVVSPPPSPTLEPKVPQQMPRLVKRTEGWLRPPRTRGPLSIEPGAPPMPSPPPLTPRARQANQLPTSAATTTTSTTNANLPSFSVTPRGTTTYRQAVQPVEHHRPSPLEIESSTLQSDRHEAPATPTLVHPLPSPSGSYIEQLPSPVVPHNAVPAAAPHTTATPRTAISRTTVAALEGAWTRGSQVFHFPTGRKAYVSTVPPSTQPTVVLLSDYELGTPKIRTGNPPSLPTPPAADPDPVQPPQGSPPNAQQLDINTDGGVGGGSGSQTITATDVDTNEQQEEGPSEVERPELAVEEEPVTNQQFETIQPSPTGAVDDQVVSTHSL